MENVNNINNTGQNTISELKKHILSPETAKIDYLIQKASPVRIDKSCCEEFYINNRKLSYFIWQASSYGIHLDVFPFLRCPYCGKKIQK